MRLILLQDCASLCPYLSFTVCNIHVAKEFQFTENQQEDLRIHLYISVEIIFTRHACMCSVDLE